MTDHLEQNNLDSAKKENGGMVFSIDALTQLDLSLWTPRRYDKRYV